MENSDSKKFRIGFNLTKNNFLFFPLKLNISNPMFNKSNLSFKEGYHYEGKDVI